MIEAGKLIIPSNHDKRPFCSQTAAVVHMIIAPGASLPAINLTDSNDTLSK